MKHSGFAKRTRLGILALFAAFLLQGTSCERYLTYMEPGYATVIFNTVGAGRIPVQRVEFGA